MIRALLLALTVFLMALGALVVFLLTMAVLSFLSVRGQAQMLPATFSAASTATLGPITGRLKHVQILTVIACSGASPSTQAGGDLYAQASRSGTGHVVLAPATVTALLGQSSATNWRTLLGWGLPIASGTVTAAGTSQLINIAERNRAKWDTAGVVMTGLLAAVSERIQGSAPNPAPVIADLIDPAKSYQVAPGACLSGLIGAQK